MVLFGAVMFPVSPLHCICNDKLTNACVNDLLTKLHVFFCCCPGDSTRLITGSADQTVKLWNVQSGSQLYTFNFDSPARSVDFSVGDELALITTDPFMELTSAIHVKRIASDPGERKCLEVFKENYIAVS